MLNKIIFFIVLLPLTAGALEVSPEEAFVNYNSLFWIEITDLASEGDTIELWLWRDSNNDGILYPGTALSHDWGSTSALAYVVDGDLSFDSLSIPIHLPDIAVWVPGGITTTIPISLMAGLNFVKLVDLVDTSSADLKYWVNGPENLERALRINPNPVFDRDTVTVSDTFAVWSRDNSRILVAAECWFDSTVNAVEDDDPGEGSAIPMQVVPLGDNRYYAYARVPVFARGRYILEVWARGQDNTGHWNKFLTLTNSELIVIPTAVEDIPEAPFDFRIGDPYPNPFNQRTTIPVKTGVSGKPQYKLTICDIHGDIIYKSGGSFKTGDDYIFWDGKDNRGDAVPAGLYLFNLRYNDLRYSKRLLYLP
ncbi:hypothetical protein JW877_06285 [bacterium]|nr:hypothetical protein [bacterium]